MIQHRQEIFFHSKTSRLVLGTTELVSGPSCHGVNRLGQEAEHSPPSSTMFSEFHYTSTCSCSVQRDNCPCNFTYFKTAVTETAVPWHTIATYNCTHTYWTHITSAAWLWYLSWTVCCIIWPRCTLRSSTFRVVIPFIVPIITGLIGLLEK